MTDRDEPRIDHLTTEGRLEASTDLDLLSSEQFVELMNDQDRVAVDAVRSQAGRIAAAIDAVAERMARGGRLIYCGAGTSGRLGVVDASECPPTFQADPSQVVGLIAGGEGAMIQAVEGAEDDPELGAGDLRALDLGPDDSVVGITASGRTPYVLGAMAYARSVGALVLGFSCNAGSEVEQAADLPITPVVGPEVLSGSTRLKAGTATKLVLNMLSTGVMVRLGKTYGNLMVDLQASNKKLVVRSRRIVAQATGLEVDAAASLLERCGGEVKTAIAAALLGVEPEQARTRLREAGGRVRGVVDGGRA